MDGCEQLKFTKSILFLRSSSHAYVYLLMCLHACEVSCTAVAVRCEKRGVQAAVEDMTNFLCTADDASIH
jgi:hypothetical protein